MTYNLELIFNPVFGLVLVSGIIGVGMIIHYIEKIDFKT